uniref:Uncharacterized protein n=1 Tax=uncultured bacterium 9F08 TaxID=697051 RepID=D2XIS0_9BACT|nr:hypothetical protein [uncultured bacterium 9F08]
MVTPSTRCATAWPHCSATCSRVIPVSSTTSCRIAAAMLS